MQCINEYEVVQAVSEQWARYHAIYRLTKVNEWMSLSFEGDIERYKNVSFCYWVLHKGIKVGGALIKPNMIKCVFVIPPYEIEQIIKSVANYAEKISDNNEVIVVQDADKDSLSYYTCLGYELNEINKIMVRATEKFEVSFEPEYKLCEPKLENKESMAELYYETYRANKPKVISQQSYEFQTVSVDTYFSHTSQNNIPREWSTLIFEAKTNRLIGNCTVGLVNELPYILDFVVHPDFQNRGLASKMIKRTLSLLIDKYPAVRLSVQIGNDAEVFYSKLGFIGLSEKYMLSKILKYN
ncbi:GNAT family N-acetyltransferase [Clostridium sp. C8-1-8]|uniref:GNAT family N-acetyltransferase n=1 Tax=Clostridium sp. C8-1-8 TaxID=2698831 RepID=UPI00136AB256|nr:GNAT family N-acetyltransferase [Clostridium sp. C8-1-8]